MRKSTGIICALCLIWAGFPVTAHPAEPGGYELAFSTYVGGQNWEHARDICTDSHGNIYVVGGTASRDFPTTPGAYDRTFHADGKEIGEAGLCDAFVMKFSREGTASPDFPVTPGAFGRRAGPNDVAVVKLSTAGALVRSALIGGSGQDGADGICVDSAGNVFFVGVTDSTDFPTTPDAFQPTHGRDHDAFVVLLSADFSRLIYSTYMGGRAFDTARSACLGPQGDLCLTGAANGPGWPVKNAVQATFAGTNDGRWGNGDCIVARFRRTTR